MKHLYLNVKEVLDYVPMILFGLLLVADSEIEKHAINTCSQMTIVIITLIIFFTISIYYKNKNLAIIISFMIWIVLIRCKKNFLQV